MKVAVIQSTLHWQDPEKNRKLFAGHLQQCGDADLAVMPEMFTTGFTMQPEQQAEKNGETLRWMKTVSGKQGIALCGSVATEDAGKYFNRFYWAAPDGTVHQYDKRHLFRMGHEDAHYAAGSQRLIIDFRGWKIFPIVCYDLRFPVWSRNRFDRSKGAYEYDVMVVVANWPAVRSYAWKHLAIARAIENQCYVVAVNRVGEDGNGVPHSGDSMVIGPRGEIIYSAPPNQTTVSTVLLDRASLLDFRNQFPAGMDSDSFLLQQR